MAIFHRFYNLFICQTAEPTDFDLWIREKTKPEQSYFNLGLIINIDRLQE